MPVIAVVARPDPIAPAAAELSPVAPIKPPKPPAAAPVNKELPAKLPNKGAKKGRKASGCPVIGFVVNEPVGDKDANP